MSQTHDAPLSVADIIQHLDNPYPLYHQLRTLDPVYWDERANSWVLTGYADTAAALRDHRFTVVGFMSDTSWIPNDMRPTLEPPLRAMSRQMLFQDPPDHTRLRGLLAKAFTPRMIESLRPVIQQVANELLTQAEAKGQMEVIQDFAFPLPTPAPGDGRGGVAARHGVSWVAAVACEHLIVPYDHLAVIMTEDVIKKDLYSQRANLMKRGNISPFPYHDKFMRV